MRRVGGPLSGRWGSLLPLLLLPPLLFLAPQGHALRHQVFWNSSNPRFLAEEGYALEVSLGDSVDVFCPHYERRPPQAGPGWAPEAFVLFLVGREAFRTCSPSESPLGGAPPAFRRWECSRPFAPFGAVRFSEKIQKFTPYSLGFEFQPGNDYYYISVPNPGSSGRCLKLRLSVCCKATTTETATEAPESQPHGKGEERPARGSAGTLWPFSAPLALFFSLWL
nr:ephrin-A4-like [Anolis sagrei ordinatus]